MRSLMLAAALAAASAMAQNAPKPPEWTWIDGKNLPIEGRAYDDVDAWYDRLPSGLTTNVNSGVRGGKRETAGMQFRFASDSPRLVFEWTPTSGRRAMWHMASTGVSGIDVYRFDNASGKWRFVATGGASNPKGGGRLEIPWTPGEPCLVNLPLYNGVKSFRLGVRPGCKVEKLPPRKSGVSKPVVFYGTSITQGACASRPGMAFVNIVGRELDVPVVNLGFSGHGWMEFELARHIARIDASCYVIDCLWNMRTRKSDPKEKKRFVEANCEPFVRELRRLRPGVPIVLAGMCNVFGGEVDEREVFVRDLHAKLVAEGWKDVHFLPGDGMYVRDGEGSVDGIHPNDWGMMSLARSYGEAVRKALGLDARPRK